MKGMYRLLLLLSMGTWDLSPVLAETFTVPLVLSVQTAPDGTYLSAPFDFGAGFSHVDSMTVEFMLPGGYEGGGLTTGNSSYSRDLYVVLQGTSAPITNVWSLNSETAISRSVWQIAAGAPAEVQFGTTLAFPWGEEEGTELPWPDFAMDGSGRVSFIDVSASFYHPLPDGSPGSSTQSWVAPEGIVGARLTIVGTPVPEPSAVLLLLISAGSCLIYYSRKGVRTIFQPRREEDCCEPEK